MQKSARVSFYTFFQINCLFSIFLLQILSLQTHLAVDQVKQWRRITGMGDIVNWSIFADKEKALNSANFANR